MNKADILDFITSSEHPVSKREIARAFGIKGGARIALKHILKDLQAEEAIIKESGNYGVPDALPSVCTVEISDISIDGDMFAHQPDWNEDVRGKPPKIEIMPDPKKGLHALKLGDRALVRLSHVDQYTYQARVIKKLDNESGRVLGIIRYHKHGPVVMPTDKKARDHYVIEKNELNGAVENDLVACKFQPSRGLRNKKVRITEVVGKRSDPKAISLISLYEAGIVPDFPDDVIKACQGLKVPPPKGREDLRDIPLVTIDGADARDFDDAVFAEKIPGGGFHLIVAIADVSYYVRPGSALDKEAFKRGNSTYFPDRVVPMLPEALSNDLCSLRPRENRACLAMHMWIDETGTLTRHKIVRALMRSEARLIYEQVQAAYDGQTDDTTDPLIEVVIKPLYEAFQVLEKARQERGALDLDMPERQIIIDDKGNMTGVRQRVRLDAHKLIEEFMILANVAAAKTLEARKAPCVYRVHDKPSMEKLDSVREFVESFGLSMPKGVVMRPKQINQVLREGAKLPYSHLISQVILRSQSQAVYSPDNLGHFGLALQRYAHFTSPIRRYADLLVHRSLVRAYGLGPGGLDEGEEVQLAEICDHISTTERTSMQAERSAVDRFTAAYLSDHIGAIFSGKIGGVTRFGLFVTLDESGADGLVPMKSLRDDFYVHDEQAHALIGRRHGNVFRLGAQVTVRLKEADGMTGSTVLELSGHENGADIPGLSLKKTPPRGARKQGAEFKNKKKTKKTTPKHKRRKGRT